MGPLSSIEGVHKNGGSKKLKKVFLVVLGVLSIGILFSQAFADEELSEEDQKELGITKSKGISVTDALAKVKDKTDKYERAKQKVGEIFTGGPKNGAKPSPEPKKAKKSTPAPKRPAEPPVEEREISNEPRTTFYLKNGQIFSAAITKRDKNGVWIEMEPGVKMYLNNSEIKESVPQTD